MMNTIDQKALQSGNQIHVTVIITCAWFGINRYYYIV